METTSTRDRLIEAGIITPSSEVVQTWTDPKTGYVMAARPTMSAPALERTKAGLVKQGLLKPARAPFGPVVTPRVVAPVDAVATEEGSSS